MKFTITAVAAMAAFASATPVFQTREVFPFPTVSDVSDTVAPDTEISFGPESAQADWSCIVYADINFGGKSVQFSGSTGICYNVPADWNDIISSVKTTSPWACTFYTDAGCGGNGDVFAGSNNFPTVIYNDQFSSLNCG